MVDEIILQHISEELEDVHSYMDAFHQTGNGIFKDLAKEELSHARILKNMHEYHGESGEEFTDQFKAAEEAVRM